MMDLAQAIAPGCHDQRCRKVVAVLVGRAVMFGIQPVHGVARLPVERVIRVRGVVQLRRSRNRRRLAVEP